MILLQPLRTGASLSLTFTVKLQVPVFPLESVEEQLTVVVPLLKTEPLAGVQITLTLASQLSVAVGAKLTVVEQLPGLSALVVVMMLLQPARTGASSSLTVTVKLQVPVLLLESVEEQLTVVVPLLKTEPLAGVQVTLTLASQLSVAVGAKLTVVEQFPGLSALVVVMM